LVWSVYNRLGFRNSEIFVPSLCEYFGLKYIGAAPNVRALIEDKSISKLLAEKMGIKTAKWIVVSKEIPLPAELPFNLPCFVKPRFGSASIGIDESCVCRTWRDVNNKVKEYIVDETEVIIEEFIDGVYYGVPIVNTIENKPIAAIPHFQISNKIGGVITHSQKRFTDSGMSRELSKDQELNKILIKISNKYFKEIQPCDYARIDFIIDRKSGIPYFLEINALMMLGIHGGFVHSFLDSEFRSYDELIYHIIELGLAKLY
jgi:D-alanine-D-alanine ligase